MFALLFQYKKVCHEFQLDPTLHFATYWRIYVLLDLNLSSWRLIMSPNEEYLCYSVFNSAYFTLAIKMFRLRHFFINISKLVIFRLYPISHSWNTLLLFQSLLVWFTAPLAIFWNEISWNEDMDHQKDHILTLCTILFAYSWDFLFPTPLSYPLSDNLVLLKSNQSSQFVCHFPTIRSAKATRRLFCLYHLLFLFFQQFPISGSVTFS